MSVSAARVSLFWPPREWRCPVVRGEEYRECGGGGGVVGDLVKEWTADAQRR